MGKTIFLLAAGISTAIACSTASSDDAPRAEAGGSSVEVEQPLTPEMKRTQTANVTATYNQNCANCHGQNGEGGGAGTKTLNTKEKFDQKNDKPFFDAIKNGVTDMGMAAFGGSMSDEMIWALVVHIREMQARALRAEFGSPSPGRTSP